MRAHSVRLGFTHDNISRHTWIDIMDSDGSHVVPVLRLIIPSMTEIHIIQKYIAKLLVDRNL